MSNDIDPRWNTVPEWISVQQAAERCGVLVGKVRRWLRDGQLIGERRDREMQIPAQFIEGGAVVKGLPGTITVLRDAGYSDPEILGWLYAADDTLPGTPIQALRENRGTEVKRRAQVSGF